MSGHPLGPHLEDFFHNRLNSQLNASEHTVRSYRDSLKLLLAFAAKRLGREPMRMDVGDIDADLVCRFLDHLETDRRNSIGSRNIRLAAIRSFFTHVSRREPALLDHCRKVGMLPGKRQPRPTVQHLDEAEIQALLDAPDLDTRTGRRDRAILLLLVQTGLRVGELIGLDRGSIRLDGQASVVCRGKGRKERSTPLRQDTVQILGEWMRERPAGDGDPLFVSNLNRRLSPDSVQRLVRKHVERAAGQCPSLLAKRISPHSLRHTAAMELLRHGGSITVIALWLGHESTATTMKYLHADQRIKQEAMELTRPADVPPGRYQPTDEVMAMLDAL